MTIVEIAEYSQDLLNAYEIYKSMPEKHQWLLNKIGPPAQFKDTYLSETAELHELNVTLYYRYLNKGFDKYDYVLLKGNLKNLRVKYLLGEFKIDFTQFDNTFNIDKFISLLNC